MADEAALAEIDALRDEVGRLRAECAAYRTVAINQGWNWHVCDAYGREDYQKQREAHVDDCVAEMLARQALSPEGEG